LERLRQMCRMRGLQNLSVKGVKSDFYQMRPSRSRFDYERGAFRSDLTVNEF